MTPARQLDGKVAIVTGAGSTGGQGAAEARLFASEGAVVVLADLASSQGADIAVSLGEQASFIAVDVTDPASWESLRDATLLAHGRVDILVNNAGIWLDKPLLDTTVADYARVISVNQTGVYLGMATIAPVMCRRRSGAIINTCSVSGMKGGGQPFAYAASKWAVRGMTRSAAYELAPHGVRVNAISPGVVDTPMINGGPQVLARLAAQAPNGRVATAEEIARVALFLAGESSSYVSGTEIAVDAALTA